MTACAWSTEEWPARTLVVSPADMAVRVRASRAGSRWAGVSPAAWAAELGGDHVDHRAGVLDEGRDRQRRIGQ